MSISPIVFKDQSFKTLRVALLCLEDIVSALFFKAIGLLNERHQKIGKFHWDLAHTRWSFYKNFGSSVLEFSSNRIHPDLMPSIDAIMNWDPQANVNRDVLKKPAEGGFCFGGAYEWAHQLLNLGAVTPENVRRISYNFRQGMTTDAVIMQSYHMASRKDKDELLRVAKISGKIFKAKVEEASREEREALYANLIHENNAVFHNTLNPILNRKGLRSTHKGFYPIDKLDLQVNFATTVSEMPMGVYILRFPNHLMTVAVSQEAIYLFDPNFGTLECSNKTEFQKNLAILANEYKLKDTPCHIMQVEKS